MRRILDAFTRLLGLALGMFGLVLFALGLWIADLGFFHIVSGEVNDLRISFQGRNVPVQLGITVLCASGSIMIAVAAMLVRRQNRFDAPQRES
jgi:hypothetical protein